MKGARLRKVEMQAMSHDDVKLAVLFVYSCLTNSFLFEALTYFKKRFLLDTMPVSLSWLSGFLNWQQLQEYTLQ